MYDNRQKQIFNIKSSQQSNRKSLREKEKFCIKKKKMQFLKFEKKKSLGGLKSLMHMPEQKESEFSGVPTEFTQGEEQKQ